MEFSTFSKIGVLIIWPVVFLLFLYFKDKEKFKKRLKEVLGREN